MFYSANASRIIFLLSMFLRSTGNLLLIISRFQSFDELLKCMPVFKEMCRFKRVIFKSSKVRRQENAKYFCIDLGPCTQNTSYIEVLVNISLYNAFCIVILF